MTSPPHARTSRRADDRRLGVVAALHEHVGTQRRDQLERRVLLEDDHGIDRLERGEHVARSASLANGPLGPLSRRTDSSLLTPTTSASPAAARRASTST